jgi:hypothetical protein
MTTALDQLFDFAGRNASVMHVRRLCQLPMTKDRWEFESCWALRQDEGILALAWVPEQPIIALLCLDTETGKVVSQEKY